MSINGASFNSLWLRDLEVGESASIEVRVSGAAPGHQGSMMLAHGFEDLPVADFAKAIEYYRQLIRLSRRIQDLLPPDLQSAIDDSMAWQAILFRNLPRSGLVDVIPAPVVLNGIPPIPWGQATTTCPGVSDAICCILTLIPIPCLPCDVSPDGLEQSIIECGAAFLAYYLGVGLIYELYEYISNFATCTRAVTLLSEFDGCVLPAFCDVDPPTLVHVLPFMWGFCETWIAPIDPNEKLGPGGLGSNFVSRTQEMPYSLHFENMATATAPAQVVRLVDSLDPNLDWRQFRLREITLADTTITIPPNQSLYQARVPLASGLLVDIDAGIDVLTGEARWTLTAIDPETGLPPLNPLVGLLAPNDSTGRGTGHVAFTIRPRAGLASGTEIPNAAQIVFDQNDPIETNVVRSVIRDSYPDFVLKDVSIQALSLPPLEGDSVLVTAVFTNSGEAVQDSVSVTFYEGDPARGAAPLATVIDRSPHELNEEGRAALRLDTRRFAGVRGVFAMVDAGGEIQELDEGNNVRAASFPVAPRKYRVYAGAGLNLLALPLDVRAGYSAADFAAALDASVVVGMDSLGQYVSHVRGILGGPDFPLAGGQAYFAVTTTPASATFEGVSHLGAIHVRRGLNLLSQPLDEGQPWLARPWGGRLGATAVIRLDREHQIFEPFLPGFHANDGFAIEPGIGYAVLAGADSVIWTQGIGWNGEQAAPPPPVSGVPDSVDHPTTAVLALVGSIHERIREELVPVADPLRVRAVNQRTRQECAASVDPHTGAFGGAFLDVSNRMFAVPGDEIRLRVEQTDGFVLVDSVSVVLSASDVKNKFAQTGDIVILRPPLATRIDQNFPNPFNPVTTIRYQLARPGTVRLEVFGIGGQLVRVLVDGAQAAGYYETQWDGRGPGGQSVASGVYFARLLTPGYRGSHKMVVLK